MKIKRTLALALTFAIVMSLLVFPSSAAGFGDTNGHWAEAAIDRWSGYGIVQGDGVNFRPYASMIVGDFAIVLNNLMGYTVRAENSFADLTGNEYYADAVLRLKAAGILEGDGVNANARETITRERATVLLARALGIQPVENASLSSFVDGSTAADWSAGYIQAMADKGIIQGVGNNTLALARSIDRASVMTILDKSIAVYVNEDGTAVTGTQNGIVLVAADNVTVENAVISGSLLVAPAAAGKLNVTDTTVENVILNSGVSATLKGVETGTVSIEAAGAAVALNDVNAAAVAINAADAEVRADGSTIADIEVNAESAAVTVSEVTVENVVLAAAGVALTVENGSNVSDIAVNGANADVKVNDATVSNVALNAAAPSVSLGNGAKVKTIGVAAQADGAKVSVAQGAKADTLNTAANNVTVSGAGKVSSVNVTAGEGVKVETEGTKVTVGDNASDVVAGGETVKPGESVTTENKPSGGGSTGGSSGGGTTTTTVSGIYGVRPVDQDEPENEVKDIQVNAKATKRSDEDFVRIALSTDKAVPIHKNAADAMGAWVGLAFEAPEGVTGFSYYFGAEENSGSVLTGNGTAEADSTIGDKKYAVFFINASSIAPKTFIELQWEGGEVTRYQVDLSGVQLEEVLKPEIVTSTHEMPSGVASTDTGLSFDGSTAAMENGKTEATSLTQDEVSKMGGGGEYTVYYTVPKAGLEFDAVVRTINGGKANEWKIDSNTGADDGSGWWTVDETNYYFKWGAVYAVKDENGIYRMKDDGRFDYTLKFLKAGNVVAEHAFAVDFSNYTIQGPAEATADVSTQWQEDWTEGEYPSAGQQIHRDEAHELELTAVLSQAEVNAMDGQFVEYWTLKGVPEFNSVKRTLIREGQEPISVTMKLEGGKLDNEDGRYAKVDDTTYLKLGAYFAEKGEDNVWTMRGNGDYTEELVFMNEGVVVATAEKTIAMSGVSVEKPHELIAKAFTQWQESWSSLSGFNRDEDNEFDFENGVTVSQEDLSKETVAEAGGDKVSYVVYVEIEDLPAEATKLQRTVTRGGETVKGSELALTAFTDDGSGAQANGKWYLKFGTGFAKKVEGVWTKSYEGDAVEAIAFMDDQGILEPQAL